MYAVNIICDLLKKIIVENVCQNIFKLGTALQIMSLAGTTFWFKVVYKLTGFNL